MKNPNGFGTVSKLSGKRRKPYVARVTIGFDKKGKQLQKAIGYFATRKEGLQALSAYNLKRDNAITTAPKNIEDEFKRQRAREMPTIKEMFEDVFELKYSKMSLAYQHSVRSWASKLSSIEKKKICELDIVGVQSLLDALKLDNSNATMIQIKAILNSIFSHAIRKGYIDPSENFIKYLDASKKENKSTKHKIFTNDEIRMINEEGSEDAKMLMLLIFTGCRPSELLKITESSVHSFGDDTYIVTGSKTDSGKNRIIPVLPQIADYIDTAVYQNYANRHFKKLMKRLNMNHTMYDARHTFASLARYYSMDPYCRKKIMGHKMNDLTDDVYTTSYIDKLFVEMKKIRIDDII